MLGVISLFWVVNDFALKLRSFFCLHITEWLYKHELLPRVRDSFD